MGEKAKGKKGKGKGGGDAGHYISPGVYVEEVSSGSRPIEAVGTSVAAFVGLSPFSARRLAGSLAVVTAVALLVRRLR